jgi:hypothetical protein
MARKIDISKMTHEEVNAYAEKCKYKNWDRVNRCYQNTVENDSVKYAKLLEK